MKNQPSHFLWGFFAAVAYTAAAAAVDTVWRRSGLVAPEHARGAAAAAHAVCVIGIPIVTTTAIQVSFFPRPLY